jgi:PBSX family phage terminase large subunit
MVAQALERDMVLFPRQQRFVLSPAPYPAYIGGIGSGKSFAGGAKVISRLGRKELGMIAAPTYPMLRDSTLEGFFRQLDDLGIPYEFLKADYTISFATGHKILCRSLDDPDRVRGPNLDYTWVDEAAFISAEAWRIVKGRVRVGVQPQAWITGTPKGRNWVWEEWERDGTGNEFDETHPLYRVRTEENPELPEGFSTGLGYSGAFASQELGGQFVAFEGLVYPTFSRPTHVKRLTDEDLQGWNTVLGLDVGARNPTSLSTYRYAGDLLHKQRELYGPLDADEIMEAVEREYHDSEADYVVVDPSSKILIDALRNRGVKCRLGQHAIILGINTVTAALNHFTIDPSCVNTIAEFESYRYPDGRRGNVDTPVKDNDHAMDEFRYVCMELYGKPASDWGIM